MGHGRDMAPKHYGTMACYATSEQLLAATKTAVNAGYKDVEAYSPIPVHGLTDILGFKDDRIGWAALMGGLAGATGGMALQIWTSVYAYAHNTGGKPLISWPMFVPVAFECTILLTAFSVLGAMFGLCGLPKPHHPVFNASFMHRASQDKFVLCIEASDPRYDKDAAMALLRETEAESVEHVMTSEGY